jgi:AcrR family transcriptional regulator
MTKIITPKETILKTCRQMVAEQGLGALNIRAVAEKCDIALGLVYYYFPSKNDLIIATIESVWEDIFRLNTGSKKPENFTNCVEQIFNQIQAGTQKYPNFFTLHSLSISDKNKTEASHKMQKYLAKIKKNLLAALDADSNVRPDAFSPDFPKPEFIDFILLNIISLLLRKQRNSNTLSEVINRSIY